jgi:hypothetical protein
MSKAVFLFVSNRAERREGGLYTTQNTEIKERDLGNFVVRETTQA